MNCNIYTRCSGMKWPCDPTSTVCKQQHGTARGFTTRSHPLGSFHTAPSGCSHPPRQAHCPILTSSVLSDTQITKASAQSPFPRQPFKPGCSHLFILWCSIASQKASSKEVRTAAAAAFSPSANFVNFSTVQKNTFLRCCLGSESGQHFQKYQ